MKTTIKDISKLAGVSISTVSRALNNTGRINPDTRFRILALSKRLGYRPSAVARSLVLRRTKAVMLLTPDITNSYFAEITKVISENCREKGYNILLGNTNENPNVEAEYLDILKEGVVDGAIVAPLSSTRNMDRFMDLVRANFPIVLFDTALDRLKMSQVIVDNKGGAETAVDYLYSKGHRNIAFIAGDIQVQTTNQRYLGFLSEHKKKGLEVRDEYILLNQQPLEVGGIKGMNRLLSLPDPPTAIFAANDLVAIGCITSTLQHGRRVPQDVAVVGYDNIDIGAFINIPLTTVAQPKKEIGQKTVGLIVDLINNRRKKGDTEIHEYVLKPELVVRASA